MESFTQSLRARPVHLESEEGKRRILVVEDMVDAAESLREALELDNNITVEVAYSGPDGWAAARRFRPDIVLCDIGLPGMDGYEVAKRIRADEALRSTTLIALTGYALPEDRKRATAAGFDRHVAKPLDLAELEEAIAERRPQRVS